MARLFIPALAAASILLAGSPLAAQDGERAAGQESQTDTQETEKPRLDFMKLLESLGPMLAQSEPFDTSKPVVGFGFAQSDKGMVIERILPNSAAESAGLKVGMVVLRINGVTMEGFEPVEIAKILGAIDGEINFDVEGKGRFSLIKAPIPETEESQ